MSDHRDPGDRVTRLGGWLFRHRTVLPAPVTLLLLLIPPSSSSRVLFWTGFAITAAGECLRLWAVRHIGAISRTRSERLGPLVSTGPFAWIRNPLYVGNVLLWIGFTLAARLVWLVPAVVALLALEYHAIVRWEERLVESRLGQPYRDYVARVPRWIPRVGPSTTDRGLAPAVFSWPETLFSERGTLVAIAAGYVLLWLKA